MGERGFSLIEAVVATALTLVVTGAAFALVHPSEGQFALQTEAVDMQQRLRVAAGTLSSELMLAGAGADRGPNAGSLAYYFAPVRPYRHGTDSDAIPGSFSSDTISLMYVPQTAAQTTLRTTGPGQAPGTVELNDVPGCPSGDPSCGFRKDMAIVVFDAAGLYDILSVVDDQAEVLTVQRVGDSMTYADYRPDRTSVAQITNIVYYLKADALLGTYQLMARDGGNGNDVPVIDHLVALEFEYKGDPNPPMLNGRPLTEPAGPWTTYGPAPPPLDRQIPTGGYPPGENCTFTVDAATGAHIPRLAMLTAGPPNVVVRLAAAELTDGPWCPDGANPNRWDADLLRIRTIGVRLRVQAANAAFRGPAGVLFSNGGFSTGGHRWLPDRELRFEVAPRNLELD
jgi:hypothetical protein